MALGSITNPFSNNTQSNYVNDSFDERILLAKQFCEENKVTQLENILKSGVSVNTLVPQFQYKKVRRNNVPLLSISVARNSIDCVKLLVKYGANIEAKDIFSQFLIQFKFIYF